MRRPRYRALSTNNKNWVYGFPLLYEIYGENWIADETGKKRNIKPKTLGQFTGLKDKYGKEIYEGDILHLTSDDGIDYNAQVVFMDGGFCAIDGTENDFAVRRYGLMRFELNIEVIGNVFENPELLL